MKRLLVVLLLWASAAVAAEGPDALDLARRLVGAGPADVVLDVGCGTGLDFEHLPGAVVGVDLSRGMLARRAGRNGKRCA